MKITILLVTFFLFFSATAQKSNYATASIPENLKENANAVIRLNQIDINISSRKYYTIKTLRVVTVFNEYGLKSMDAYEYNDINNIEATIYNSSGAEIKKIKRKDFRETAVSEGSIITDNKAVFLDYTPTVYPFTIEYKSEISSVNTAFIPSWYPIDGSFESVEKSVFNVTYISDLGFKYKEYNFDNKNIQKTEKPNFISFVAENLPALKSEEYSPALSKFAPYVLFGLEKFSLEGVQGTANDWENFSAWIYNDLLVGTDQLSPETQSKIKALVGDEKDPMKKAKIVYEYVQNKVRYVSIQLGIGGWKPMLAADVDRLGYGDCKALTNYTRALLEVVDVPSYYTVIYGDTNKRDLNQDFVSMQGNHVILAIPQGEKLNWLECTSQTLPFGFQGDFTDDRLALIIRPEGGKLVRTNKYSESVNHQVMNVTASIDEMGFLKATLQVNSTGLQYDQKFDLERKSNDDIDKFYKSIFSNINNLKVNKAVFKNDKEKVDFSENLDLEAVNYGKVSGNTIIFPINIFNQSIRIPARYRTRMNPFEVDKGMTDTDQAIIEIPTGYSVESKPENFEIKSKFGTYNVAITTDKNQIIYKRQITLLAGSYSNSEYEEFRKLKEQIAKYDNAKVVLVKNL